MSGRNRLRKVSRKLHKTKPDELIEIPGELGIKLGGQTRVEVPSRPGFVYVRLRNDLSELVQAFNDKVSPIYGLPVTVVRDRVDRNKYSVVGRDTGRYNNWGSSPYLPLHGGMHSFDPSAPGMDPVWVWSRQFTPFLAVPSGSSAGMNVLVYPGTVYYNDRWIYAGMTGTAAFDSFKPTGSNARAVLVYLNQGGNPELLAGDYFSAAITGTSAFYDSLPSMPLNGLLPLAGVPGTNAISWDNLYDLRQLTGWGIQTGTSASGGGITDHGALDGLGDDDHTQYHTDARGDARYWLSIPNGRLTLESGNPTPTTDQGTKTTIYYTPYQGNRIALFDGSEWGLHEFSEVSLALTGATASRLYDIFAYMNGATLTLERQIWTNSTTRATALALQDGVLVKSGAPTRRYLGTIYINSTGGQTDDTVIKRNVWNYYNRRLQPLTVLNTTAHDYNGGERLWNNSETNNRLEFVIGYSEDAPMFSLASTVRAGADGSYALVAIYLDGAGMAGTLNSVANFNAQYVGVGTSFPYTVAAGFHYLNVYQFSNHASSRFNNCMIVAQVPG